MRRSRLIASATLAVALVLGLAPTVLAAHPTYRSGTGSIKISDSGPGGSFGFADLDAGITSCNGPCAGGIDVDYYIKASPLTRYLESEIGIKRMGSRPGYAKCAAAFIPSGYYEVTANIGRWFCIQTSDGRYARLRINGYSAGPPARLNVTYKVWCKPGDLC